jgi:hypothetical protein
MSNLTHLAQVTSLFNNHAGLLGTRRIDLPVGGKIRPGIKVLTPKASRDERAVRIYAAGTETGKYFDTIEAEIRAAAPGLGGPLMPTNTPYFTVWGRDFRMPEIARLILEKFGEDRGDGAGRQLYRFPVIFPADDPDMILPHALRCWGSGQLKYWSEYGPTGALTCRQYVPIKVVDGKREFKPFGGRKIVHYYGAYSNAHRGVTRRREIFLAVPPEDEPSDPPRPDSPRLAARRKSWAKLIRRVYEVDPLLCRCGERMRVVGFITQPPVILKILHYIGRRFDPLKLPGRSPPLLDHFCPDPFPDYGPQ